MDLFSPLPKEYCLYFKVLSIISFAAIIIVLFYGIINYNSKKFMGFTPILMAAISYFIIYFQNRLLYGMCAPVLKREGLATDALADKKSKQE